MPMVRWGHGTGSEVEDRTTHLSLLLLLAAEFQGLPANCMMEALRSLPRKLAARMKRCGKRSAVC
jgi:hypothetical protein